MADQAKWNRLHNTDVIEVEDGGPAPFRVSHVYHMNMADAGYSYSSSRAYHHHWHVSDQNAQKGIYRPTDSNGALITVQRYLDDYFSVIPSTDDRNLIGGIRKTDTSELELVGWGALNPASEDDDMIHQYGTGYLPRYFGQFYETLPDIMIRVETPGIQNPAAIASASLSAVSVKVLSATSQDNGIDNGVQSLSSPSDGFTLAIVPIFSAEGVIVPECFAILVMYSGPYFEFRNYEGVFIRLLIDAAIGPDSGSIHIAHTLIRDIMTN